METVLSSLSWKLASSASRYLKPPPLNYFRLPLILYPETQAYGYLHPAVRYRYQPTQQNRYLNTSKLNILQKTSMKVIPIPVLEDNYAYILIDDKTKEAAVIDPVEPSKILNVLSQTGAKLTSVLTTHHHFDHSGGNIELVTKKPGLAVYGADARIPEINYVCKDNEEFKLGTLIITPYHTPCHTKGSLIFHVTDPSTGEGALFTGDTLFIAGCGRFFEGDARDMYRNLIHVISPLPPHTYVFCGHEYTKANLKFALSVDPGNPALHAKWQWTLDKIVTVPSTLAEEMTYNPFLRVHEEALRIATGKDDPVEVMATLREMKNGFR